MPEKKGHGRNAGELPAAEHLVCDARQIPQEVLALAKRQMIHVAESEYLPANDVVISSLQVARILILSGKKSEAAERGIVECLGPGIVDIKGQPLGEPPVSLNVKTVVDRRPTRLGESDRVEPWIGS